ncbi:MAG: alpha/beta fold hydrolase [Planctomycetota bacterium]
MKSVWLKRGENSRVLLFFAGWGMDDRPFRELQSDRYDVCVCFDYRDLDAILDGRSGSSWPRHEASSSGLLETSATYDTVTVVGWSFGCAVAARIMARADWPVRDALAINGTVVPEDDQLGIPSHRLDATAQGLLQGGWPKFVRRMCVERTARLHFQKRVPQRELAGALIELDALRSLGTPEVSGFTQAIVGSRDKIIWPENQERCWRRFGVPTRSLDVPHYPFHLWQSWEEVLALAPLLSRRQHNP